jgi:hypothetical protein
MLKKFIGITAVIFNKFKYFTIFALTYYSNKIDKEIIGNKIEYDKLDFYNKILVILNEDI